MSSINSLLKMIEEADESRISEIIGAVIRRYNTLYPDWEVFFYSVPRKNSEERRKAVDALLGFLEK